jgi:ParB family chromosome partitioning protein
MMSFDNGHTPTTTASGRDADLSQLASFLSPGSDNFAGTEQGLLPQDASALGLVVELSCGSIRPSKFQARTYFDPEFIGRLAKGYREHPRRMPPILARCIDGGYEIIWGEQRLRGAIEAGQETILAIVDNTIDDDAAEDLGLLENLHRRDLSAYEKTMGMLNRLARKIGQRRHQQALEVDEVVEIFMRFSNQYKYEDRRNEYFNGEEWAWIVNELERVMGITPASFRRHYISELTKLPPDLLVLAQQGRLEYTKISAIARIKNEEDRRELTERVLERNPSLKTIEAMVKEMLIQHEQDKGHLPVQEIKVRIRSLASRIKPQVLADPEKLQRLEDLLREFESELPVQTSKARKQKKALEG